MVIVFMQDHLCSERRVFVCSWELSQNDLYWTLPCYCLLFSPLLHEAPGKHLHLSTNIFEMFFNSSFCLIFPQWSFSGIKTTGLFRGKCSGFVSWMQLSKLCSCMMYFKLYTAFLWGENVALAIGLNLCLAVYVGWYTITDMLPLF